MDGAGGKRDSSLMATRTLAGKDVEKGVVHEVRESRGRSEFGEQRNREDNESLRRNIKFCVYDCFNLL